MRKAYLAVALAAIFSTSISGAATKTAVEMKTKSQDLIKVKEELARKRQEKEALQKEAEDLSNSMKSGEIKIQGIEKTILYTRQKNAELEQGVALAKNRHDRLIKTTGESESQLRQSFKTYYVASLLNGMQAPSAVAGRQAVHTTATRVRRLRHEKDQTGQSLDSLIDSQIAVRRETERQQAVLSQVKAGLQDKERLLNKKLTRHEALETELRELQKTAEELASLIDVLRTKAALQDEESKRSRLEKQASGQSPIKSHSLPWPVEGRILTKFGRQIQPVTKTPFISNGVIIGVSESKPVQAVFDGQVLYAGIFMSYGSMVLVEHPGDWYTVYGHLSQWDVEKGQAIKAGQTVGSSRPKSGGGHEVYFELRFYGKPTDPEPWLNP